MLGDCNGTSCSNSIVELVETLLRSVGLSVARNRPYSGGFTTKNYGRPSEGVQVIQIEINRSLYMNQKTVTRRPELQVLREKMELLVKELTSIDAEILRSQTTTPLIAAE